MLRTEKQVWIDKYKTKFSSTDFAFIFRCDKINAEEMTNIRNAIKGAGGEVAFAKNTLARLAVTGTDCASLQSLFKGVSVMVIAKGDKEEDEHVSLAKSLVPFIKANKKNIQFAGGVLRGQFMSEEALDAFSKMPSRIELLGNIAMLLKYPLINIADTIKRAGESKQN